MNRKRKRDNDMVLAPRGIPARDKRTASETLMLQYERENRLYAIRRKYGTIDPNDINNPERRIMLEQDIDAVDASLKDQLKELQLRNLAEKAERIKHRRKVEYQILCSKTLNELSVRKIGRMKHLKYLLKDDI